MFERGLHDYGQLWSGACSLIVVCRLGSLIRNKNDPSGPLCSIEHDLFHSLHLMGLAARAPPPTYNLLATRSPGRRPTPGCSTLPGWSTHLTGHLTHPHWEGPGDIAPPPGSARKLAGASLTAVKRSSERPGENYTRATGSTGDTVPSPRWHCHYSSPRLARRLAVLSLRFVFNSRTTAKWAALLAPSPTHSLLEYNPGLPWPDPLNPHPRQAQCPGLLLPPSRDYACRPRSDSTLPVRPGFQGGERPTPDAGDEGNSLTAGDPRRQRVGRDPLRGSAPGGAPAPLLPQLGSPAPLPPGHGGPPAS